MALHLVVTLVHLFKRLKMLEPDFKESTLQHVVGTFVLTGLGGSLWLLLL